MTSPTATEPKWRDQQAGAGQALEQMTVEELEAYLIPPVGTGREDVESFFGFAFEEGGVKLDEDTKVTGYALFYPVHMEVIYEEGKVAKAALHHRVDLTEWQSDLQLEIMEARHKAPEEIDEWLKQGYLHFCSKRFPSGNAQGPTMTADRSSRRNCDCLKLREPGAVWRSFCWALRGLISSFASAAVKACRNPCGGRWTRCCFKPLPGPPLQPDVFAWK